MMRAVIAIALMIVGYVAPAIAANAENGVKLLAVDLAEDHVDITTGFNGAYLSVFGVQDEPGDIVIVIRGPKRDMIVRKKKRFFGIWTNLRSMKFEDVPAYYDYALEDVNKMIAAPEVLKAHGIGVEALYFEPEDDDADIEKVKMFQEGLSRNKRAQGHFPKAPQALVFIKDNFFKTKFYIPANVPTGDYVIETFLIQNGMVKDMKSTDVRVAQVGTSAGIYSFSKKNSVSYGLLCVFFAMLVGWFSNAIRRRV